MAATQILTGKTRLRVKKSLFGSSLVYQVEVKETGVHFDHYGDSRGYEQTFWRDARVEDVTEAILV
jgi:hypothetical protein